MPPELARFLIIFECAKIDSKLKAPASECAAPIEKSWPAVLTQLCQSSGQIPGQLLQLTNAPAELDLRGFPVVGGVLALLDEAEIAQMASQSVSRVAQFLPIELLNPLLVLFLH